MFHAFRPARVAAVAALALGSAALRLGAQVLVEPFSYPDGELSQASAGAWVVQTAGTALAVANGAAVVSQADLVTGRERVSHLLSPPFAAGSVVYISCDATWTALPLTTSGSYFLHLGLAPGDTSVFYARLGATLDGAADGSFRVAVANANWSQANAIEFPADLALNTPYKIVVKYDLATQNTTLWVNPTGESSDNVVATDAPAGVQQPIGAISLRQGLSNSSTGAPGTIRIDNLVVGTAFDQVVVVAPPKVAQAPAGTTVAEGSTVTFTVVATEPLGMAYSWTRNGTPVPGATNATLVYGPVSGSDDGASFVAILANRSGTASSDPAVLKVVPDTVAPALLSAFNVGTTRVQVVFSEPLALPAALQPSNYTLDAGATVTAVEIGTAPGTVVLTTSPLVYGTTYTLVPSNLFDRASVPNPLPAGSRASFLATDLQPTSIGSAADFGSVLPLPGQGYRVTATATGSVGAADQIEFGWQKVDGDFDRRLRVESLSAPGVWAEAGFMVRETLDPAGDYAEVVATPSLAGVFFRARAQTGATVGAKTGTFPANYPQTWLRLQRQGNVLTGYAGYDGRVWTSLGSASLALPKTVYLGVAAASLDAANAVVADFRDLGDAAGASVDQAQVVPVESPGPSTRRTCFAITEIMFAPAGRTDGRDLRFVELFNSNPWPEELGGYQIAGDFSYTFPAGTTIPGGGYLVVATTPSDVAAVHNLANVAGPCAFDPSGPGTLQLLNDQNAVYLDIPYRSLDPWTTAATGTGHSLVLARPSYGEGNVAAWNASGIAGGSPGTMDAWRGGPLRNAAINEFLANPADGQSAYIEVYNHAATPLDLSGCRLVDHPGTNRFVVPAGTIVPAAGFVAFDRAALGFAPSPTGGALYLLDPDGVQILDVVLFEAQQEGVATGRVPDGSAQFHRLVQPTPGTANGRARVDDIVINELMYKPLSGLKADQYVELFNQGSAAVDLSGWSFVHGINYTFPDGTSIPAGGYYVVARDTARLMSNHPALNAANTFGPFSGSFSGSGERVALARPLSFVTPKKSGALATNQLPVILDEVTYGSGGRWGHWADGGGSSLELRDPRGNHREPGNWADSDETAKAPWTTITNTDLLTLGSTQGNSAIDRLEIQMPGEAECLLDDVRIVPTDAGTNVLTEANSRFESGLGGWFFQGTHLQSHLETSGGFGGGQCLHVHATDRGDTMGNHIRVPLTRALPTGRTVSISAKARWLRGFPEIQLRIKGNYAEAFGALATPPNLGTPGERNSQAVPNAGPAITGVLHAPAVPASQQPVVVTARIADPDGLAAAQLRYRVDPATTYTVVAMRDDGTGGDAVAGDGIYSATIPGMAGGTLVAFQVTASDAAAAPAASVFPDDAPARECLVRFGDPVAPSAFGSYRMWITQAEAGRWASLGSISNERHDATFVHGNSRVIYNIRGKFGGSPYHQGFGSPLDNNCHYSLEMPGDDVLLGATSFNKIHAPGNGPWEDDTIQREQTAYWMARKTGIPWNYRRYVTFTANGNRRQPASLMEDTQTPDTDVVAEHFPNDANGKLFKLQPWFEFADDGTTFDNKAWCTLNIYNVAGAPRTLRYRPNFLYRAAKTTANDYSDVYALVNAAHQPTGSAAQQAAYIAGMESLVDTENWMRTMAIEHAVGNWDSFLNSNGQNMYGYKPTAGRWTLFIWDYNIVLGLGNYTDGPSGDDLFKTTSGDNSGMNTLAARPKYRRALWRAFAEIANGPMNSTNVNPLIDARYAAFRAEGLGASAPTALKSWIATRHTYLANQVKTVVTAFTVGSPGPGDFSTDQNPVVLSGTAPMAVQDLEINGIVVPVTWTDLRHWQVTLALTVPVQAFAIRGLDRFGNPVAGSEARFSATYTGVLEPPAGKVVFNEIMYNPSVPGAQYLEFFNASATTPYDLSGWRVGGLGYAFPAGTVLPAGAYAVLARDRTAFVAAYGTAIPVLDTLPDFPAGAVDTTLKLIAPTPDGREDLVVSAVRFRAAPPWPDAANGHGASLQLLDPTHDNARVANWTAIPAGSDLASYTPGAANSVATNLPPFPALWINEVLPENTTTNADNAGDRDPFVEIVNAGATPADLGGLALTDDYGDPARWPFPAGTTIPAGGHLVVWADGQPAQSIPGIPHASFRLAPVSGSVALASVPAAPAAPAILDYLDWSAPGAGRSVGAYPDAQGLDRRRFARPTPGLPNDPSPAAGQVWINEWMAANSTTLTNAATGTADDWFELYNPGTTPIDLGGYQLANSGAATGRFTVPGGTVIPAGGFLLVWADKHPAANAPGTPLHAGFKLNKAGSEIHLYAPSGDPVDQVAFGPQAQDASEGRFPDGAEGPYAALASATPGGANSPVGLGAGFDAAGNVVRLRLATGPGLRYRLVYRDALAGDWKLLEAFTASTPTTEILDPANATGTRFYLLVLEIE